jgi:hypothetical protein
MKDVAYLAIVFGFFAMAVAYVSACSRILGPETAADLKSDESSDVDTIEVADDLDDTAEVRA